MVEQTTEFERQKALIWVCDIEGSSRSLNSPSTVDAAEEYLKRFFWVSRVLLDATRADVRKWTGDGFLASYSVPLERELGAVVCRILSAVLHLTMLNNVTNLRVDRPPSFRLRHGMALDTDAILVKHVEGERTMTDVIGRGAVLAFRLSGMRARFPSIVTHRRIVTAAREAGSQRPFRRRKVTMEERQKYFKGEPWGTSDLYESAEVRPRKRRSRRAVAKLIRDVIREATEEHATGSDPDGSWTFFSGLLSGPEWANLVVQAYMGYVQADLLGVLARFEPEAGAVESTLGVDAATPDPADT